MIAQRIAQFKQNSLNEKLSLDISYTLISFLVLAVSGIIINITISLLRDPAALGVFNLSYTFYIIASQFAVIGIQYSILRHAAYYRDCPNELGSLLLTGCICALILGLFSAVIVFNLQSLFQWLFNSEWVAKTIGISSYGLALFPLNKVLLSYLNALKEMKSFSIVQGIRYLTVMIVVAAIAASSLSIENTGYCFLIAEVITMILAIYLILKKKLAVHLNFRLEWVIRHFTFGSKSLIAGMFADMNSRLDVLLVGYFLTAHDVGVYSFASMLVDGLYHILAMVRLNFNPILVNIIKDKEWAKAKELSKKCRKYILPIMATLSMALFFSYILFTLWIVPHKGLQAGIPSLFILLTGLVSISFFVPFDNVLMVSGHPGYQSTQQMILVLVNLIIASILLPILGIKGAAIGTVMGYLTGTSILIYFTKKLVGWSLLSNTYPSTDSI